MVTPAEYIMAANIDELVIEINRTNNLLTRQLEQQGGDVAKNTAGMWAVGKLTLAVEREMKKAFNDSLKLHEKSLGRGLSLKGVLEATRSQQVQMAGTLTGFGTAVEIGYEQFESGLLSNNAATNELALYTKLTGGNSKKLLKEMASLTRGMSLNNEQESALSNTIQGLSQNFKMTSEEIVGALQGLGDSMRAFKFLGVGAEMTQGAATLSAAMGKASGDMGSKLISTLLSAEGVYTAAALKVSQERRAVLQSAGDPKATTKAMFDLVLKAGQAAKDLGERAGKGGDPMIILSQLETLLGRGLVDAKLAYDQLKKMADKQKMSMEDYIKKATEDHEVNRLYTNSWEAFKREIMGPLQKVVMEFAGTLMNWAVENKELLSTIVRKVGRVIAILGVIAGINMLLKGFGPIFKIIKFLGVAILGKFGAIVALVGSIGYGLYELVSWLASDKKAANIEGTPQKIKMTVRQGKTIKPLDLNASQKALSARNAANETRDLLRRGNMHLESLINQTEEANTQRVQTTQEQQKTNNTLEKDKKSSKFFWNMGKGE